MEKLTKEQVETLKKKHGEVFEIEVEDKVCYLKKPTRKVLSLAATAARSDEIQRGDPGELLGGRG